MSGVDPRAPELEAFGVNLDGGAELNALRDLRALVLRVDAEGLDGNRQPNFRTWQAIAAAARAAMTPATFDPATGLDAVKPALPSPPIGLRPPNARRVQSASRLAKLSLRERSDRRGLDVVEIEACCQHELIKCNPGRYKIDSDGWLVDTKGRK
jgi:hypothetical protein